MDRTLPGKRLRLEKASQALPSKHDIVEAATAIYYEDIRSPENIAIMKTCVSPQAALLVTYFFEKEKRHTKELSEITAAIERQCDFLNSLDDSEYDKELGQSKKDIDRFRRYSAQFVRKFRPEQSATPKQLSQATAQSALSLIEAHKKIEKITEGLGVRCEHTVKSS